MPQFLVIILIIIFVLFNIYNNSDNNSSSKKQPIQVESPKQKLMQTKSPTRKQIHANIPNYSYTEENTISEVYANGKIIKMIDGSVYQVWDYDSITSSIWLPMTDVVITDDRIINVEDNESVDYVRQLR